MSSIIQISGLPENLTADGLQVLFTHYYPTNIQLLGDGKATVEVSEENCTYLLTHTPILQIGDRMCNLSRGQHIDSVGHITVPPPSTEATQV